jgi:hypothetical protein
LGFSLAFIFAALIPHERAAMAVALAACVAYGASAGAWLVAARFKD